MYWFQFLFRQIWSRNLFSHCNIDHHHLFSSLITAPEGLATQDKAQMKLKFIEVETTIKIKLRKILEPLNQRHSRAETVMDFVDGCIINSEEQDLSTLYIQKNQLIDSQEHFERYCNVLLVFGFNSAKYDLNLIKFSLLPILVSKQH